MNFEYLKELGVTFEKEELTKEVEATILNFLAWGIPGPTDPVDAFSDNSKTLFADRYGGSGIGYNWGSGRAASSGEIQLKGIGKTTLVSSAMKNHKNGTVPIEEGMREAVWGEVNNNAPYKANRVIALIDRGTKTEVPDGSLQRDVIIIRENSIRPANFMKAKGSGGNWDETEDFRVKEALGYLSKALPKPRDSNRPLTLGTQIFEFVDRVAEQFAYLFANRLYHGAPSPSNIEISGKLIDYGTETAQSGYGEIKILRDVAPSGDISDIYKDQVGEFIEGIKKKLPKEQARLISNVGEFKQRFEAKYQESLKREFLKLTGMPEEIISKLNANGKFDQLALDLMNIATTGAKEVIAKYEVPDKLQKYDLNSLLSRLAETSLQPEKMKQILEEEVTGIFTKPLRNRILADYQTFVNEGLKIALSSGETKDEFLRNFKNKAKLLNRKMPWLYRWKMMDEDFKVIEEYEKTGDTKLIRDVITKRIDLTNESLNPQSQGFRITLTPCRLKMLSF